MENTHEKLADLSTIEQSSKSCFFSFLQLMLVPFFVYGYFVLGYLHVISLNVHKHSLVLMGIIFLTSIIFIKHNAFFARCVFKNNITNFNKKLKEHIIKNLLTINNQKKSNSPYEIFAKNESKNIRNDNYASIATSIFPTMGILGTFISIALTMPNFASSSSGELEKEIGVLLSGVGTAFYVSIYGILLSLWWMFYEKLGLSLYEKDIAIIKENTKVFFWTKEEIEQAYLKENLTHFKEIASMLSTISNEDFLKKLSKKIESKFAIFDQMMELETKASKLNSQQFKQNLLDLEQAQKKQYSLEKLHVNILKTLQNFSKGLDAMELKSLENFNRMQEGQKDVENSFVKLNETLQINMKNLQDVHQDFSNELRKSQEEILSSFAITLDKSIQRFWDESKLAAEERAESLKEMDMEELKRSISKTLDESEKVIQHMNELK